MTTNTYDGYTVAQLREFIRHHYDAEHGGDNIDELSRDNSASVTIVRDLLDAIEPQQDGDLLRPIARWVYNAVRVNLDLLHGICMEHGCQPGDDVAMWLRDRLSSEKSLAPVQASEAADQRPGTEGNPTEVRPTAEVIVDARAAGGNETSSKVSRAVALNVAAALEAYEQASIAASECDSVDEARVAFVRSILAASPVEQHEAAPPEHDVNQLLEAAALGLERAGMLHSMRIVRGMKPGYPKQPDPPASLEGAGNGADEQQEQVCEAIAKVLGGARDCTRVWSAWGAGTMGPDDFRIVADDPERVAEIADAAINAMSALSRAPCTEVAGAVPIAWVRADDPREAISDEKKCDMIAHAGAPGKKLAECYSIPAYGRPPSADAAAAPADERAAFPRYTEWMHLRRHGAWSDGVPDWARDHAGRMNDFTAAVAVIEELAARAAASQPAARPEVDEAIVGAWMTDDDRAITAAQKQRALADGGATASSVQPYSIPCYLGDPPAQVATRQQMTGAVTAVRKVLEANAVYFGHAKVQEIVDAVLVTRQGLTDEQIALAGVALDYLQSVGFRCESQHLRALLEGAKQ
ncbi:hypothetical protein [Burkholderia pyrrocinia]|uniref:hypothetical protein n=1 Tax=Burkholderia pyrrocinia TaxID=60550 RepID=UPI00158F329E|nr:hypothetical protein [Burkholderia pyrrocinia]